MPYLCALPALQDLAFCWFPLALAVLQSEIQDVWRRKETSVYACPCFKGIFRGVAVYVHTPKTTKCRNLFFLIYNFDFKRWQWQHAKASKIDYMFHGFTSIKLKPVGTKKMKISKVRVLVSRARPFTQSLRWERVWSNSHSRLVLHCQHVLIVREVRF